MKKKIAIVLAAMMLFTAGCGNSGSTKAANAAATADTPRAVYDTAAADMAAGATTADEGFEEYYEAPAEADMADMNQTSAPDTPATQATNRKLIRNISMSVETREFEVLVEKVTQRTAFFGGYIENSSTYNGSNYSGRKTRNSSMTLRIPAAKMDEFLSEVAEVSNVVQRDENVSDVTLNYVDMESHKNALKAQEKRLLEMMDRAETIEDLITLESRLGDIRYQIESMESQLRTYDNQVDYATLRLSITEVEELTPVEEQTDVERMEEGFFRSLKNIGENIKNFFINLVIDLPYLIISLIKFVIVILVVRFIAHRIFGKHLIKRSVAFIRKKLGIEKPADKRAEEKAEDTKDTKDKKETKTEDTQTEETKDDGEKEKK
ncbi:MAG: DUF4349 domain-containing protein [Lachnospiraceae bacterium]|nr:DUF4349 domain-containing protein [Lachnospiraceae bacterium]